MEKLYVIASFDWMDKEEKVGTLGHEYLRGSDVFSFEFDKNWLKTFPKIDFGQDLRPYTGVQYSRDNHIFGCFSGVGALVILISKNSQRLGDLAAGTMVIQLNDYRKIQVSLDEFYYLDRKYKPVYPQAEDLSLNQLDVIQRTLNSEYGYERERRIASLAEKVRTHLNISDTNTADEKFLYTIVRDYQHFTLEII